MKHLRGYQHSAVDLGMQALESQKSCILDMATGTGKTVVIAEIVRRFQPSKSLILAHRRDLVKQAKDKVESFAGLNVSVEMGGQRASRSLFRDYDIVVSSVQSQTAGRRFNPNEFDLLVIDEVHHLKKQNKSYMDVINHYKQNPRLKILGVTATLEPGCLNVIPHVAFNYPILSGIREGYLVEPRQQMVNILGLDYSHVKTTAGDLNMGELGHVLEQEKVCQGMIQATLEVMFSVPHHSLSDKPIEHWGDFLFNNRPKRNLVFTVNVAQARMMSDIFNRVMPNKWAWVCSDTRLISEEKREQIGKDFQSGDLLGVCNCGIYSEGYDNVYIDQVTMARPTKSLTLYKQQIGRETRVLPGVIDGIESVEERLSAIASSLKPFATTLDFVGNSGRHKLISVMDIVADGFDEVVKERAKSKAVKSGRTESMTEMLEEAQEEIHQEKIEAEQAEIARKARLVAKAQYSITSVNPFEKYDVQPRKHSSWDDAHPLEQWKMDILAKEGITKDKYNMTVMRQLFPKVMQKPSAPQVKWLLRNSYDPSKYSRKEASAIMNKWEKNAWQRPSDELSVSSIKTNAPIYQSIKNISPLEAFEITQNEIKKYNQNEFNL